MKKSIILFISLFLLINCNSSSGQEVRTNNNKIQDETISILSTRDLNNLTKKWVDEYSALHSKSKIKIINLPETQKNDVLSAGANLCFVTNASGNELKKESSWKMVVGHDAIVPVINAKNPFLGQIYKQGISSDIFAMMFQSPEKQKWGTLLKNSLIVPVNYYLIDDESIKSVVTVFLNTKQILINGIKTENGDEMISKIQKDPYGIGFCRIADILDLKNLSLVENIKLLPIDKNGNGKLDRFENIYEDVNVFLRGIWVGKYPKSLSSDIYAISSVKPNNENEKAFLKWVLTDGQRFLNSNGYYDLAYSERQAKVELLSGNVIDENTSVGNFAILKIVLMILVALILAGFIIGFLVRIKHGKSGVSSSVSVSPGVFDINAVIAPKGLFFDKTHTWAFMEKEGIVRIGIDDFLHHVTGPLTQIKMKNPGEKITKGEQVLTIIQKGKQLKISTPISGTIKAINNLLVTDSSVLNSSPYSEGWVYIIEPSNWLRETQFFIMAEKYKEWLKSEIIRLKDFLSATLSPNSVEYAYAVYQDGGELKENILVDLGPEVWEDFQTNFIDTSK